MATITEPVKVTTEVPVFRKHLRNIVLKPTIHLKNSNRKKKYLKPFEELRLKGYIIRMYKMQKPNLQLSNKFVEEMNDFMRHVIEMFGNHLESLMESNYRKTLTASQLEKVTRLCLPKLLDDFAIECGRHAIARISTHSERKKSCKK
ncbi:hypothetical protein TNCT_430011 [Trichonephila clavata]|uniref:Histone H2A/H2B/H3 domain-containing protein n=1 Tax=Trichonephila clavata TaxID=2740835 RepID=A0A8X6JDT7_TRICU|nr:hypothetical protein TNCT_430011 [Trichonephila clavata]